MIETAWDVVSGTWVKGDLATWASVLLMLATGGAAGGRASAIARTRLDDRREAFVLLSSWHHAATTLGEELAKADQACAELAEKDYPAIPPKKPIEPLTELVGHLDMLHARLPWHDRGEWMLLKSALKEPIALEAVSHQHGVIKHISSELPIAQIVVRLKSGEDRQGLFLETRADFQGLYEQPVALVASYLNNQRHKINSGFWSKVRTWGRRVELLVRRTSTPLSKGVRHAAKHADLAPTD